MMSLKDVKWKAYRIDELFYVYPGKRLTKADMVEGNKPFVGATDSNNGLTAFCGNSNVSEDFNVLGVNYNGSVGCAFYHPYHALFSDDVKRLHLKEVKDDKYIYLFIKSCISSQRRKFEYGYKFNGGRMLETKILLPSNPSGDPDYTFMDAYMRVIERQLLDKYRNYIKEKWGGYNKCSRSTIKWEAFMIEEIAEINSGHDIYQRQRIKGDTPYVSATANQNGIGYFVGNNNETLESGCISVNRNGSVGYSFYHPYAALFGNDTRKLRPFNKNKYVCLFIAQAITSQRKIYGYGLKMGTGRLKKQKILLPATLSGDPDYAYMENYMRHEEAKMLKRYIDYKLR